MAARWALLSKLIPIERTALSSPALTTSGTTLSTGTLSEFALIARISRKTAVLPVIQKTLLFSVGSFFRMVATASLTLYASSSPACFGSSTATSSTRMPRLRAYSAIGMD